jgi:hypothetical protein
MSRGVYKLIFFGNGAPKPRRLYGFQLFSASSNAQVDAAKKKGGRTAIPVKELKRRWQALTPVHKVNCDASKFTNTLLNFAPHLQKAYTAAHAGEQCAPDGENHAADLPDPSGGWLEEHRFTSGAQLAKFLHCGMISEIIW